MPSFSHTVPEDFLKAERLDKYIASLPEGINRSRLKSGVTSILVNGKKSKLSTKVSPKDFIQIEWEESVSEDIEPQNIPLDIIYEDENVTVINKKQGMVTHPAAGNWEGTLVNALLFHWGRNAIHNEDEKENPSVLQARRPGIVHRLDKDTSGIIITARNRDTETFLAHQFKNHNSLSKIYIAICQGHPPVQEGIIRTNIARDIKDRKKFRALDEESDGKLAVSKFKCIGCYGPYSLIKIKIYTGRTHQIRVHLKWLGCPIVGDPIYSKPVKGSLLEGAPLMLHAFKLKIRIPGKAENIKKDEKGRAVFISKVPVRFKIALKKLHQNFQKSLPENKKEHGKILVLKARKGYGQWQK